MLSAVAARKAALAAQSGPTPEPLAPSGSGTSSPKPPSLPKKNGSKRKSSSQTAHTGTKKPRKLKPFEKSNPRSVDSFKEQDDVIMVDSEGEESESAISVLDDSEPEPIPQPSKKSLEKRTWSPSRPADSSEDDSEEQEDGVSPTPLDLSSLFPHLHRTQEERTDEGRVLSTFKAVVDENLFYLDEEELSSLGLSGAGCLVALNIDETLCLLGVCALTVLHGSITVFGTTLSASLSAYPIYAPRSSPLPIIKPSYKTTSVLPTGNNLPPRLLGIPLSKTVIFIRELKTNVEGLGEICRTFHGVFQPSGWQRSSSTNPFQNFGLSLVMEQGKEVRPFIIPSSWEVALNDIACPEETRSYIVKGPKNSGKSTFARTLVNRLLESYQRVAFLECDLGQSEFTPGGMVSLNVVSSPIFGPAFTHPTLPNYAHYIGSVTPRSSPSHYLDAVQALIQTYHLDVQNPVLEVTDNQDSRNADAIPIVVNTMGWTKGLGADLTQRIESMLEPTDVFDIQAPVREEFSVPLPPALNGNIYGAYHTQSTMMTDKRASRIHVLEPISAYSSAARYNAADYRSLSILSYFHARFPKDAVPARLDQVTARSWDVSRPLCAVPPYQVDCTVAFDKIMLTGSGSEDVVEEEIGRVLNAAVVAFVSCEPRTVERGASTSAGIPYTRQQGPPFPESSNCVGIGLIRGVSPPKTDDQGQVRTFLHMLTPLPHQLLASARVLVKGEMELPVWGMLDFRNFKEGNGVHSGDVAGVAWDKVPFLQWGKAPEGVMGGEKRRVRRNLMRRGQMM